MKLNEINRLKYLYPHESSFKLAFNNIKSLQISGQSWNEKLQNEKLTVCWNDKKRSEELTALGTQCMLCTITVKHI